MSPTIGKSPVSDISYKAYMGKIVICRTLAMSIYHHLYSCMVTMCMCTCLCTGVSKNSRFSTVYVHKKFSL